MDTLKTLMDKREYSLVVKLTEDSKDANSLFYRVSALLAMGNGQDALFCIEKNRPILETDLSLLIKIHIEILCLLGRFDDARKELEYYQTKPYVSQVVEETLRDMPNLILMEEKKTFGQKNYTDDQIREKLENGSFEETIAAIDMLRNRNVNLFIPDLQKLMISNTKQSIRSFALFLLVDWKINREMRFLSSEGTITVNPSKLDAPFVGQEFEDTVKMLYAKLKDPSIAENAVHILSTYIISIYPEKVIYGEDLYECLEYISKKYLGKDVSDFILLEEAEKLRKRIEELAENF